MTLGTKDVVRDGLSAIAGEYGADEVMIVTITHSHEARRHSYELIAEAFRNLVGELKAARRVRDLLSNQEDFSDAQARVPRRAHEETTRVEMGETSAIKRSTKWSSEKSGRLG